MKHVRPTKVKREKVLLDQFTTGDLAVISVNSPADTIFAVMGLYANTTLYLTAKYLLDIFFDPP